MWSSEGKVIREKLVLPWSSDARDWGQGVWGRGMVDYPKAENMGIFNTALTVDLKFFCFSGSLIGYFRHLAT